MNLKTLFQEIALNDSQTALQSVFRLYYAKLSVFILYYIKSHSTAEEIASDVFVTLWHERRQLVNVNNPKAFLYTIARNIAISHIRREKKGGVAVDIFATKEIVDSGFNPEAHLISSELMRKLDEAVESLPEKCRIVFKMIREERLKYREVAEILNVSVKTIETHMRLAIRRLQEVFAEELEHKT